MQARIRARFPMRWDPDGVTGGNDLPAAVGTLDEWEWRCCVPAFARPITRFRPGNNTGARADIRGIPAKPGVHVGIVHAGCQHLNQHFTLSGDRDGDLPIDELVKTSIAGRHDRLHYVNTAGRIEAVRLAADCFEHRHQKRNCSRSTRSAKLWPGSKRILAERLRSSAISTSRTWRTSTWSATAATGRFSASWIVMVTFA